MNDRSPFFIFNDHPDIYTKAGINFINISFTSTKKSRLGV
jgi:hypothetical protein